MSTQRWIRGVLVRPKAALVVWALVGLSCGDGLDPDSAASIGPGNATGTMASGLYDISFERTDCSGSCGELGDSGLGEACLGGGNLRLTVTQNDGVVKVDLGAFFVVPDIQGSLDASGAFDLGGVRLSDTGLSGVLRAEGSLVNGTIDGTARGRLFGTSDELSLDCVTTFQLQGMKRE